MACTICKLAKVDYIKTSSGFGNKGTQLKDMQMIEAAIGKNTKIKASGGI